MYILIWSLINEVVFIESNFRTNTVGRSPELQAVTFAGNQ